MPRLPKPNTPLQTLIDESNKPRIVTFETKPRMSWEDTVHFIAQGAINISEGMQTIEPGSKIHRAMESFCDYMCKALVTPNKVVIPIGETK